MENIDIRKADSNYKEFPKLSSWQKIPINQDKWNTITKRLEELSKTNKDTLDHAQRIVRRYAAIETGAIENLYETDRGFTWSVALELSGFEAILDSKGDDAIKLINSQMSGYDYLLDLATNKQIIAETWIRELHKILCKEQIYYKVVTSQGLQDHKLSHGTYKRSPNHVVQADGSIHSYCPVDLVGAEMNRLVNEIKSDKFKKLHPIKQAAYAHYSFVHIHPFSDGNGRVARAIASIFLLRSLSIPLFVLSEDRDNYIESLEIADKNDYQSLISYTVESCLNAVDLIELSISESGETEFEETIKQIDKLYLTKGGYSLDEIDSAGQVAMDHFHTILSEQFDKIKNEKHFTNPTFKNINTFEVPTGNRLFVNNQSISKMISLSTTQPINAMARADFRLYIPIEFDQDDRFIIHNIQMDQMLKVRMDEILPLVKPSLLLKFEIFIKTGLKNLTNRLFMDAKNKKQS